MILAWYLACYPAACDLAIFLSPLAGLWQLSPVDTRSAARPQAQRIANPVALLSHYKRPHKNHTKIVFTSFCNPKREEAISWVGSAYNVCTAHCTPLATNLHQSNDLFASLPERTMAALFAREQI